MFDLNTSIWSDYDYHNRVLNNTMSWNAYDDTDVSLERYPPYKFRKETVVFRFHHFKRIVSLNRKIELPISSILHTLDNLALTEVEWTDTPRLSDNKWVMRESNRKMLHHIKAPNLGGAAKFEDKFIFQASGLPTKLMKYRSELDGSFKIAPSLQTLSASNNVLNIVNHNPIFRVRSFGQLQYFKKIQFILTHLVNTIEDLVPMGKQQYVDLTWGSEIYTRQLMLRTTKTLNVSTVRRPNDHAYIILMHILNFILEGDEKIDGTTSVFRHLSEEALKQTNLMLHIDDKYVVYNLYELRQLGGTNKIYMATLNQMNLLAIMGRADATPKVLDQHLDVSVPQNEPVLDDEGEEVVDDDALEVTIYELPSDDEALSSDEDTTDVVKDSKVIDTLDKIVKKANPFAYPARTIAPVTKVTPTKVPVTKVTQTETKKVAVPGKVVDTAQAEALPDMEAVTEQFISHINFETEAFINSSNTLTPAQKDRYRALSKRYETLTLGDKSVKDILANNDITIEESVLSEDIGYLPDKSALKSSASELDKAYIAKSFERNLIGSLISFHKHGAFLIGIKEEKSVSQMANVTHYSFQFEDINGKKSTIRAAIPRADYHGRIKIDGKTHVLKKQRINKPIVKIAEDKVSLTTNYNKARVIRNSSKAHNFLSFVDRYINDSETSNATIVFGSCQVNRLLPYEYSMLASKYRSISFKDSDGSTWMLNFDYLTRMNAFNEHTSSKITADKFDELEAEYGTYLGSSSKHLFFMGNNNLISGLTRTFSEEVTEELPSKLWDILVKALKPEVKVNKQLTEWADFVYLSNTLPMIFVLAYRYGLKHMLDYLGITYTITEGSSKSIVTDYKNEILGDMDVTTENYGVAVDTSGRVFFDDKYPVYYRRGLSADISGVSEQIDEVIRAMFIADMSGRLPTHHQLLSVIDGQYDALKSKYEYFHVLDGTKLIALHEYTLEKDQIRLGRYWVDESYSGINLDRMMLRALLEYSVSQGRIGVLISCMYHSRYDKKIYHEMNFNLGLSTERIFITGHEIQAMTDLPQLEVGKVYRTRGGKNSHDVIWVNNKPFKVKPSSSTLSLFIMGYEAPSCSTLNAEVRAIVDWYNENEDSYGFGRTPLLVVVRITGRQLNADSRPEGWYPLSWSMRDSIYNLMPALKPRPKDDGSGAKRFMHVDDLAAYSGASHSEVAGSPHLEAIPVEYLKELADKYENDESDDIDVYTEALSDYVNHIPKPEESEYYYHISLNDLGDKFEFTPRIPEVTLSDHEDQMIPRVCVSTSIEGCILGCPYIFVSPNTVEEDKRFRSRVANCYVYAIPRNQVEDEDFVSSKELVKRKLVFDADVTDEVWITRDVVLERVGKIKVTNNKDSIPIDFIDTFGEEHQTWLFPYTWTDGPTIEVTTSEEDIQKTVSDIFDYAVRYFSLSGRNISLAYSDTPINKDGTPNDQIDKESFGGCVTTDKVVYVNYPKNMPKVMAYWKVSDKYTLVEFYKVIISHELAHVVWDEMSDMLKSRALSYIPDDFNTEYTMGYDKSSDKYQMELFCEWKASEFLQGYRRHSHLSRSRTVEKHLDCVLPPDYAKFIDTQGTVTIDGYEVFGYTEDMDIGSIPCVVGATHTARANKLIGEGEILIYQEDEMFATIDLLSFRVIEYHGDDRVDSTMLFGSWLQSKLPRGLSSANIVHGVTKNLFGNMLNKGISSIKQDVSKVSYLESLDKLKMHPGEYVIGASAAARLYGYPKDASDMDIVVLQQETIDRLLHEELITPGAKDGLHDELYQSLDGVVDISPIDVGHLHWDIDTWLERSTVIDGYRFLTWEGLYIFYKELFAALGKKKHLDMIAWMDEKDAALATKARPAPKYKPKPHDIRIRFKDKTLWINRYPTAHSLIVAGLDSFDLSRYEFTELNGKDAYHRLMNDKKKSSNYLKGIDSFFDLFIDNMAFTDLSLMGEPTNVKDLLIRAVGMLTTLEHLPASSADNHKIRGYEQFNAIIYNEMARQFAGYQARRTKANVFSVPPDAVYLRIVKNSAMIPSDAINPLQDLKESTYLTHAGVGGRTSESFVIEDRKYTESDIGILSEATPDNANVAISAHLSMDPIVENTTGMTKTKSLDELEPANILSGTTLVFPFSTNDDEFMYV